MARLSERLPYSREELEFAFEVVQDIIKDALISDGRARTPLGVFRVKIRKSRRIVDIYTKKPTVLPERKEITFTANKKLKEDIDGKVEFEK